MCKCILMPNKSLDASGGSVFRYQPGAGGGCFDSRRRVNSTVMANFVVRQLTHIMSKNQVPQNVRQLFDDYCAHQKEKLEEELQDLLDLLKICESPLEQMLLLEFAEVFDARPRGPVEERHLRGILIFPNVDRFSIAIRQQHVISTRRKSYRADFCIT